MKAERFLNNRFTTQHFFGEKMPTKIKVENPISELIDDEVFELLQGEGLLDEKGIRNYLIQNRFKQLRVDKKTASEAISILQEDYPYLGFDTLNKIVYKKKK